MIRRLWLVLLPVMLAACTESGEAAQGTLVGNPGKTNARIAPGEEVEIIDAVAEVLVVNLITCAGATIEVIDDETDPVEGASVEVPGLESGAMVAWFPTGLTAFGAGPFRS